MSPQAPSPVPFSVARVDWRERIIRPRKVKVNALSRSKFWARGRARRRESEKANAVLTTADRCDRCGALAYIRVRLPNALELLFCAHHGRQHAAALAKVAVEIHDETRRLAGTAA
jgi:hypothetical protein